MAISSRIAYFSQPEQVLISNAQAGGGAFPPMKLEAEDLLVKLELAIQVRYRKMYMPGE